MTQLDEIDKRILNRIQSNFPITQRPYGAIGEDLGLTESEVLRRITRMRETGLIRRIGGNFVPEKLGYVSTLCAASVSAEKLETFTHTVNQHTGVTHNYIRDNHLNIWFTFIAPSRKHIQNNLMRIAAQTGIQKILNLPATRVFKIKAHFNL